jgi:hypothetical protein
VLAVDVPECRSRVVPVWSRLIYPSRVARAHAMSSETASILAGAAAGVILTGGVQATQAWLDRKRRARTAARLIAGDLVLQPTKSRHSSSTEGGEAGLGLYLTAWSRHSEDFATAVKRDGVLHR